MNQNTIFEKEIKNLILILICCPILAILLKAIFFCSKAPIEINIISIKIYFLPLLSRIVSKNYTKN